MAESGAAKYAKALGFGPKDSGANSEAALQKKLKKIAKSGDDGALDKAKKIALRAGSGVINSPIGRILSALDLPRAAVVSTAKETADAFGSGDASLKDLVGQTKRHIGVGEFVDTGNKWGDRALGFLGDVALDPLTYATAGTYKVAQGGGKLVRMGAEQAAREAVKGGATDAAKVALRKGASHAAEDIGAKAGVRFKIPFTHAGETVLDGPLSQAIAKAIDAATISSRTAARKIGAVDTMASKIEPIPGLANILREGSDRSLGALELKTGLRSSQGLGKGVRDALLTDLDRIAKTHKRVDAKRITALLEGGTARTAEEAAAAADFAAWYEKALKTINEKGARDIPSLTDYSPHRVSEEAKQQFKKFNRTRGRKALEMKRRYKAGDEWMGEILADGSAAEMNTIFKAKTGIDLFDEDAFALAKRYAAEAGGVVERGALLERLRQQGTAVEGYRDIVPPSAKKQARGAAKLQAALEALGLQADALGRADDLGVAYDQAAGDLLGQGQQVADQFAGQGRALAGADAANADLQALGAQQRDLELQRGAQLQVPPPEEPPSNAALLGLQGEADRQLDMATAPLPPAEVPIDPRLQAVLDNQAAVQARYAEEQGLRQAKALIGRHKTGMPEAAPAAAVADPVADRIRQRVADVEALRNGGNAVDDAEVLAAVDKQLADLAEQIPHLREDAVIDAERRALRKQMDARKTPNTPGPRVDAIRAEIEDIKATLRKAERTADKRPTDYNLRRVDEIEAKLEAAEQRLADAVQTAKDKPASTAGLNSRMANLNAEMGSKQRAIKKVQGLLKMKANPELALGAARQNADVTASKLAMAEQALRDDLAALGATEADLPRILGQQAPEPPLSAAPTIEDVPVDPTINSRTVANANAEAAVAEQQIAQTQQNQAARRAAAASQQTRAETRYGKAQKKVAKEQKRFDHAMSAFVDDSVAYAEAQQRVVQLEAQIARTQGREAKKLVEEMAYLQTANAASAEAQRLAAQGEQMLASTQRLHAAHQRALADAARQGKRAVENMVGWAKDTAMVSRVHDMAADGLRQITADGNLWAEDWVLQALEETQRVMNDVPSFIKLYDKALSRWKAYSLLTPGTSVRNFFGGMFNNALADVDGRLYDRFATNHRRYARGGIEAVDADLRPHWAKMVEYGVFDSASVRDLGDVTGVSDSAVGLLGRGMEKIDPTSLEFAPLAANRKVASHVEKSLRGPLFLDRMIKSGGDVDDALEAVARYHFDYEHGLSGWEKRYARRVMPFYTWTRLNFPLQIEEMMRAPGHYTSYLHAKRNVEMGTEEDKIVPSYYDTLLGIKTPLVGSEGDPVYFMPDLPFRDLSEQFDVNKVIGQLSPALKMPLEVNAGKQFFNEVPFTGRLTPVPSGGGTWSTLVPVLAAAGGKFGLPKPVRSKDGKWLMSDKDIYKIEQALPLLGKMRRNFPNEDRYEARETSTWLSFVFGIGTRTLDTSARKGELSRRNAELQKIIANLRNRGFET